VKGDLVLSVARGAHGRQPVYIQFADWGGCQLPVATGSAEFNFLLRPLGNGFAVVTLTRKGLIHLQKWSRSVGDRRKSSGSRTMT
jgi:hypothetical protein